MWRCLADSVTGTSHRGAGMPCQDGHRITTRRVGALDYLVIACADGAGSASHSDVGARVACEAAVTLILDTIDTGHQLASVDRAAAQVWVEHIRGHVSAEGNRLGVPARQVACTLLLAVVGAEQAVFIHVGDGAIVVRNSNGMLTPVFWPKTGEYANTTFFVTEPDVAEMFQFERRLGTIEAIAVFTDGLQGLALNYADRSAYEPFFGPMFNLLRTAEEPSDLDVPFRAFLDSPAINERTDDDKTLVVAVRMTDRGDA